MPERASTSTHREPKERWTGVVLLILGLLTSGTGVYFMVFRPPMLPEDVRFSGVDPKTLPPGLHEWLGIVFRTLGGFVAGLGILLSGLGASAYTGSAEWQRWGLAMALLVAFGRFLASNVVLRSDFLWFVALLCVLAAALVVWTIGRHFRSRPSHEG